LASLILIYSGFIITFAYIGFYYQKPATNPVENNPTAENKTIQTEKIFTTEELAKYDGKNNQPAYIAVDGIVYDVSDYPIVGKLIIQ
jgi:cytochrome b involved in lipid metabolism